ncbi:hypothetical protein NFX37_13545 [Serratia marcescens]|nr:hypothetical protein NFX37_13545 [Serratia marcescens]
MSPIPTRRRRGDRAGADRRCTRAGRGSRRDRARGAPLALTAGAVATGAYRHHERQDAYDEINHLQQQRIDELNHLQAQRINNFNSRHPR